eukprot:4330211-Pleurochrysis_carterae.AAC.1
MLLAPLSVEMKRKSSSAETQAPSSGGSPLRSTASAAPDCTSVTLHLSLLSASSVKSRPPPRPTRLRARDEPARNVVYAAGTQGEKANGTHGEGTLKNGSGAHRRKGRVQGKEERSISARWEG